jgi:hypothetical protein
MGRRLRSHVFGHFIQPKPSNQLSDNHPRRRQTPVDLADHTPQLMSTIRKQEHPTTFLDTEAITAEPDYYI